MGNKGIEIVIADGDSTQIAKQIATYASKDEIGLPERSIISLP